MRITSMIHTGVMAFVLTAGLAAVAPAFAGTDQNQAQQQQQAKAGAGPYDGAWFEASKASLGQN